MAQRPTSCQRIIKWAARINNNKAPGPFGAAIRDLVMPPIMKLTANNMTSTRQFAYHVDWEAPTQRQPS